MSVLWKAWEGAAALPRWYAATQTGAGATRLAAPRPIMAERTEPSSSPPNPPPSPEAALVQAARAGDRRACFLIWSRYAAMVERLVRRFLGPGPDHQDICQEIFLRVFKRLGQVREPAALSGFVVSVALGVARNEVRRRRIRAIVGFLPEEALPQVATAAVPGEAREAVRSLYALLDSLGAQDRSLFIARFVEKMEVAEVAAAHAMSHSTAKRRLARLVRRVNERMQSSPALRDYVEGIGPGGEM